MGVARGAENKEGKADGKGPGGRKYCCPHCSDSKYPCVNMERAIRAEKREVETEKKISQQEQATPPGC